MRLSPIPKPLLAISMASIPRGGKGNESSLILIVRRAQLIYDEGV